MYLFVCNINPGINPWLLFDTVGDKLLQSSLNWIPPILELFIPREQQGDDKEVKEWLWTLWFGTYVFIHIYIAADDCLSLPNTLTCVEQRHDVWNSRLYHLRFATIADVTCCLGSREFLQDGFGI